MNEEQTIQKLEIGQIYETSWGYDQTNYDFIVIIEVSPSGKTAVCKRARYNTIGHTEQTNIQQPTAEAFGKSFRMKKDEWRGKIGLRGSYIFCGNEESESKRFGTFSLCEKDDVYHETDSMFGH